jgi:hypothetical protein
MPAEKPFKLPPVRAVDAVRRRLLRVEQRMVPAPAAVLDLTTGAWVSRAIYTATKFGIADVLSDGPRGAEEIARKVDADPDYAACSGCWRAEEFSLSMATAGSRSHRWRMHCAPTHPHPCGASCCTSGIRTTGSIGPSAVFGADRPAQRRRAARQADVRVAG